MKRVLILSSVCSMIDQFNMPNIKLLQSLGYEVHVACNFKQGNTSSAMRIKDFCVELDELKVKHFQIDFSRDIKAVMQNIKAYKQVYNLLHNGSYEFVHCQSPIGGVAGRIAGYFSNTKVIYTAHGFHFFKGSSLFSRTVYYTVEKFLSRFTDVLITINHEDYNTACKFNAEKVWYIAGVGIDTQTIMNAPCNKPLKRYEMDIPEDGFILVSVGELNENKNHKVIIDAMKILNNPNIYYVICGKGKKRNFLKEYAVEQNLAENVRFLGFCSDVPQVLKACDVFCFPSQREGLGIAALEAMACGLPLVTSNVHGINDYSENNKTGFSCDPQDAEQFAEAIRKLYENPQMRTEMSEVNKSVVRKFDIKNVNDTMKKIYTSM